MSRIVDIDAVFNQDPPFCASGQLPVVIGQLLTEKLAHLFTHPVAPIGSDAVTHLQICGSDEIGNHPEREPRVAVVAMSRAAFSYRAEIKG